MGDRASLWNGNETRESVGLSNNSISSTTGSRLIPPKVPPFHATKSSGTSHSPEPQLQGAQQTPARPTTVTFRNTTVVDARGADTVIINRGASRPGRMSYEEAMNRVADVRERRITSRDVAAARGVQKLTRDDEFADVKLERERLKNLALAQKIQERAERAAHRGSGHPRSTITISGGYGEGRRGGGHGRGSNWGVGMKGKFSF